MNLFDAGHSPYQDEGYKRQINACWLPLYYQRILGAVKQYPLKVEGLLFNDSNGCAELLIQCTNKIR